MTTDKLSAYQTLYSCLSTVAKLAAPIAPFYMDLLYTDLNNATKKETLQSIHISDFPICDETLIDKELEERMNMAQKVSSMVLGLRRKEKLKVRQPLTKIMIPILNDNFHKQLKAVEGIILSEINVKEIDYITETTGVIKKKIKANFKTLGPKFGKIMKQVAGAISQLTQDEIAELEVKKTFNLNVNNETVTIGVEDVEILSEDIPGWLVASEGAITVALDIHITEELRNEGIAREFVNRIQNIRKDSDFEVTDKIKVQIQKHSKLNNALEEYSEYISNQTLAASLQLVDKIKGENAKQIDIDNVEIFIVVEKQLL
jgi:isoleucyl-tRNA synthetase